MDHKGHDEFIEYCRRWVGAHRACSNMRGMHVEAALRKAKEAYPDDFEFCVTRRWDPLPKRVILEVDEFGNVLGVTRYMPTEERMFWVFPERAALEDELDVLDAELLSQQMDDLPIRTTPRYREIKAKLERVRQDIRQVLDAASNA